MEHFNQLTPAELERLAILSEECAEVIHIINKIIRHGYESHNPHDPFKTSNRYLLQLEISDVSRALERMTKAGDIKVGTIEILDERPHGEQYLHHQGD